MERNGDKGAEEDDEDHKHPKRPSKVNVGVEELSDPGPSESGDNDGRCLYSPHNHPILQRGHVRHDDVDNILHTKVSDPVERLAGSVHLDVGAGGLDDQTSNEQHHHDHKPFETSPNVDDLGDGKLRDPPENGGDDAGGR